MLYPLSYGRRSHDQPANGPPERIQARVGTPKRRSRTIPPPVAARAQTLAGSALPYSTSDCVPSTIASSSRSASSLPGSAV